ncbi:MAG: transpeptidase family protein [Muribaculaceae bacterium]|nr:transpeptidase family protein [Muribaculaceae bacterium]
MKTKSKRQNNKKHIFLRYLLVVMFMLLFAVLIVLGMVRTTIVQADQWNNKADSILTKTTRIEPERGKLLADNGTVLAANMHFYTARIDWEPVAKRDSVFRVELPALCDSLSSFDPSRTPEQWKEELLTAYSKKKGVHAYRLFRRLLTHNEFERVKLFPFFNLGKIKSGFYCERQAKRSKPYGAMASRSIGTVAADSLSSEKHGRSGLEMALDSLLYGVPGEGKRIQLNAGIVTAESVPALKGYDITTTINVALQDIVETELYNMCVETDAQWGTCVLMEVATGEIKAISNLEKSKISTGYVEGRNYAVLGFEPGSVMKPISMMIALEDGIVSNIDAPMVTGSVWNYEGRPIKDPHGSAQLSPRQIIETSSNIGMSRIIVSKYGKNPGGFYDRLKGMGFFDPIHSGIGGETTPIIQRLGNAKADRIALTRMAFGYSTLIPPLSTLAMYNAIANDGKYVRPRLVKKLSRDGQPDSIVPVGYIRPQVCSPENARKLRIMLHDVVWGSRGTARKWVQDDRVEIAGKTGTAYTISGGQYGTQKRLAFCGFFPYEQPKYSCIVLMLGANRGAAASSGMVLRNVAAKMYARGLLGEPPSYAVTVDKEGKAVKNDVTPPTFYASSNKSQESILRKGLAMGKSSAKKLRVPDKPASGVPDVKNLNVREAVRRLEDAGLCVRFTGSGFVAAQSLAPGSTYTKGQIINLTLRHG